MEHRICSSTMLFVVSYGIYPIFYPIYEFKFNVLVFLIMAPLQKLVLASGATIQDNTVCFSSVRFIVYKWESLLTFNGILL